MKRAAVIAFIIPLIMGSASGCPKGSTPTKAPTGSHKKTDSPKCKAFLVVDVKDHGYEENRASRLDVYYNNTDCSGTEHETITQAEWLDSACSPNAGGEDRYYPDCLSQDSPPLK